MLNKSQQKILSDILFSSDTDDINDIFINSTHVYAIVDGAQSTEVINNLIIWETDFRILYRSKDADNLSRTAPYIVLLDQNCSFTQWLITKCYGNNFCIFIKSHYGINTLSEHYNNYTKPLMKAQDKDMKNKNVFFAFYDPRVFPHFLKSMNKKDFIDFFDMSTEIFCEDEIDRMNIKSFILKKDLKSYTIKSFILNT